MIGRFIYKLLKPLFLKYYFLDQSKKRGFDLMQKVFIDSNGKEYYKPVNDFDYPHERIKELEKKLMRLRAGLSDSDLDLIYDAMEKALNNGKKADIAEIGFLIKEMRRRKDILIHPDIMFDIVATTHIRSDEDPYKIDPEIHQQKIEQFRKDSTGGLYDFFYSAGLSDYIPYLSKLEEDWSDYILESKVRIEALQIHLKAYTTGSTL